MVDAKLVRGVLGLMLAVSAASAGAVSGGSGELRGGVTQVKLEAAGPTAMAPAGAANMVASADRSTRMQASATTQQGSYGQDDEAAASPGLMVASWALVALIALRRMFS